MAQELGQHALGQLVDTAVFITIAFAGTAPLLPAILGQYLVKLVIASLTTPLIYAAVGWGRAAMARAEPPSDAHPAALRR